MLMNLRRVCDIYIVVIVRHGIMGIPCGVLIRNDPQKRVVKDLSSADTAAVSVTSVQIHTGVISFRLAGALTYSQCCTEVFRVLHQKHPHAGADG